MEVVVESLLSGAVAGRSVVRTVSTATVDSLISAFCAERGVTHWKSYILTDKDDVVLDNSYTLTMCAVTEGDTLYLTAKGGNETALGFHNWWIMVVMSAIIGSVGLVAVSLMFALPRAALEDYGIVFDAGSTHTLMHVYRWPGEKSNGTGEPVQIGRCQKDVGIAHYAETPTEVGEMLKSCVDEAKNGMVPQDRAMTTPIFLGATGGMRLLEIRNETEAEAIMVAARLTFASSGFSYSSAEQVRVLDGSEEGADAWVTANFLNGTLARVTGDQTPTVGILDMGGASMQISFQTDANVNVTTVQAFGIRHQVFSISYLCFGARESARRRSAQLVTASNYSVDGPITDPCLPKGFTVSSAVKDIFQVPCTNMTEESVAAIKPSDNVTFEGSGDFEKCSSDVRTLMNTTECSTRYSYCFAPPNVPLPQMAFMGLANFYYVMQSLNFTDGSPPSLAEFDETIARFCNRSRSEVLNGSESLCFQSVYVRAVLIDGFGFNSSSWNNLVFVDSMKGTDVDWALGYMMNETNIIPAESTQPRMQLATFVVLILCFVAFFLLAIGFGIHAYKLRSVSPSYQRFSQYGAI